MARIKLTFPVSYPRSRMCSVLYRVPLPYLVQPLSLTGVTPVGIGGGHGIASLTWFEHDGSSLGAYRELGVGILASTDATPLTSLLGYLRGQGNGLGAWMVALPVTSEAACTAGIELAGLPKKVHEIRLDWSNHCLNATLLRGNDVVLGMVVPLGRGLPVPVHRLRMYSRSANQLLETTLVCGSHTTLHLTAKVGITLEHGSEPWADWVSKWIATTKPLGVVWGHLLNGSIAPPRVIRVEPGLEEPAGIP